MPEFTCAGPSTEAKTEVSPKVNFPEPSACFNIDVSKPILSMDSICFSTSISEKFLTLETHAKK